MLAENGVKISRGILDIELQDEIDGNDGKTFLIIISIASTRVMLVELVDGNEWRR